MLEDDVRLIRRTLSGDESAFNTLVQKHQKSVHALIWRKVGDFHFAEELTQDTFVQVYRKLGTLKDPKCFAGWLYVIANRLSLNWIQRRKPTMQSLEDTPAAEIEESSYTHHMMQTRETEAAGDRSEIVKDLLEKLPESERTVVTLHYLGEMTVKDIGNFLGVSVNTIKSRLRRGRERLQNTESLVSEVLGSLQLPLDLTDRIMRQVADINPIAPPAGKPFLPWVSLGAATILVALLLGASYQYLATFQKPYSFEARSEPTIEIVDVPIVLDVVSKPAVRRQFGRSAAIGRKTGAGMRFSQTTLRSNAEEDLRKFSSVQWLQTGAPPGGHMRDIFTVSDGTVYAVSSIGIYKLAAGASTWMPLNMSIPVDDLMPIAESRGTLYVVSTDEIFASADKGETWQAFCVRPDGDAIGFVITDEILDRDSQSDMTMYLALRDKGVFRSVDAGRRWESLSNGLADKTITAVAAVGKTVFTGTNRGLYRLDLDVWRRLPVGRSEAVYSLAVIESNLYVGIGPDLHGLTLQAAKLIVESGAPSSGRIFRSINLGTSWTEITPKSKSHPPVLPSGVRLVARGETLLALGATQFRSRDGGDTWTNLGVDQHLFMLNSFPAAAVNDRTFYKVGAFGIHRTTDGGESWHIFMDGVLGTRINDMVVFNNRLYAHTGYEIYQSTNEGVSWKKVPIRDETVSHQSVEQNRSRIDPDFRSRFVRTAGMLYYISPARNPMRIFRLSEDGDMFIRVQAIPTFDTEVLSLTSRSHSDGAITDPFSEVTLRSERWGRIQAFAISGDMFYVECDHRLFKWRLGDSTWTDTGFVDLSEPSNPDADKGFKLAASEATVYVGKRDGQLFQSLDEGRNWRDITLNLPLRFNEFKEIRFVGSTIYVATDEGVLTSETGEHWRVIMDKNRTRLIMRQFAVNGPTVYGMGNTGVYRLDTDGYWQQLASEAPSEIVSLGVNNDSLYGATKDRGIFQISLAAEK